MVYLLYFVTAFVGQGFIKLSQKTRRLGLGMNGPSGLSARTS